MRALSRKRKALFGAAVTLAVLLLLELGLRVLGVPAEKALLDSGLQFPPADAWGTIFDRDPARHWRLHPGNDLPWGYFRAAYTHERDADVDLDARMAAYPDRDYYGAVTWQVNARGWRGALPESADGVLPAPGRRLILFLGSSFTFGWGVRAEDAFPGLVGEALRARGWDVINAGVPGYSTTQSRIQLAELLRELKPAVVVVDAGINDGVWAPGPSDEQPRPQGQGSLPLRSQLLSAIYFAANPRGTPDPNPERRFFRSSLTSPNSTRVSRDGLLANLDAMQRMTEAAGGRIQFVFPGLYNEYGQGRLLQAAQLTHERAVPCVEPFRKADDLSALFLPHDEAHLSRAGHALLAEQLLKRLADEGVR